MTDFLGIRRWMDAFTRDAKSGAYLRVIAPGFLRAGDAVSIIERPDHDIMIGQVICAMMREPELLAGILTAVVLAEEVNNSAA